MNACVMLPLGRVTGDAMTPEDLRDWTLPLAVAASAVAGFLIVSNTVRISWVKNSITWAIVTFGFLGAALLLSPKWERILLQWGELKAEIASLREQNTTLVAENSQLNSQIQMVSSLGNTNFRSAEDLVTKIATTRSMVDWAKFLPSGEKAYALSVEPGSPVFVDILKSEPSFDPLKLEELLKNNDLTLVQSALEVDLQKQPPDSLWVMPSAGTSLNLDPG
jgi:hypothetical protein